MKNTEYYDGLRNFLSHAPSGLKSTKGDVVILITPFTLDCSVGNKAREEYKIIETTVTNHSLVFKGIQIHKLTMGDFEGKKAFFKIVKTESVDALGKPLFKVNYRDDEGFFTLFLIKPEEN